MRYVPGNIVDTATLITTLRELKAHGVATKFAIPDAGYMTAEGVKYLYMKRRMSMECLSSSCHGESAPTSC